MSIYVKFNPICLKGVLMCYLFNIIKSEIDFLFLFKKIHVARKLRESQREKGNRFCLRRRNYVFCLSYTKFVGPMNACHAD